MTKFRSNLFASRKKEISKPIVQAKWLHQRQMEKINRMQKDWLKDYEVNSGLESLLSQLSNLAVIWPTGRPTRGGGMELLNEDQDLKILKFHMDAAAIDTIVIPVNNGIHWQPVCMKKINGNWGVYKLVTKADGTCGQDTIKQAKLFAESKSVQEFKTRGGRIDSYFDKTFAAQLEKAKYLSLETIDTYSFELNHLADWRMQLDAAGDESTAQRCQINLINARDRCIALLQAMSVEEKEKCIDKLLDLSHKKEIQEIISAVTESASLFHLTG